MRRRYEDVDRRVERCGVVKPVEPEKPIAQPEHPRKTPQLPAKRTIERVVQSRHDELAVRKLPCHLSRRKHEVALAFRFAKLAQGSNQRNVRADLVNAPEFGAQCAAFAKMSEVETVGNYSHLMHRKNCPQLFPDKIGDADRDRKILEREPVKRL